MQCNRYLISLVILSGSCSSAAFEPGNEQASMSGGMPSGSRIVRLVQHHADGSEKEVGNATVVGPAHLLTASRVFLQQGTTSFDEQGHWAPSASWGEKHGSSIGYVVRAPQKVGNDVYWNGEIAVAIMLQGTYSQPWMNITDDSDPNLSGSDAYCAFTIAGFGKNGERLESPYCMVSEDIFFTTRYMDAVRRYLVQQGGTLSEDFFTELAAIPGQINDSTMLFVTYPSAFHAEYTKEKYQGSACPSDIGSPILEDGLVTAVYVGDVPLQDFFTGPVNIPSCSDHGLSMAMGASLHQPESVMSSDEFVRRAVNNCDATMSSHECQARILCDTSQGHYRYIDNKCLPSCGELARLKRDQINAELMRRGKSPETISDSCALWCDNGQPNLPYWSAPILLGQSFDCMSCAYYPPGIEDYPSQCGGI